MVQEFAGKTVVVTGAAFGIGAACARAFAQAGARIAIVDANGDGLARTAEGLAGSGHLTIVADVALTSQVDGAFDQIEKAFGRLDVAVNNAGVEIPQNALADIPEADFDRSMSVNLKSFWACLRRELPIMVGQGGGSIVNTSSVTGLVGMRAVGAYAAAKHGILGLTKVAALDYADKGIRVNAICPGAVRTELLERKMADNPLLEQAYSAKHPIGRIAEPSEIADAVLWLSGDKASFVVGHALVADGGWTVQ